MKLKTISYFVVALLLASCITPSIRNWPEEVPRQSLFVRAYRADIENQALQTEQTYLEWILGFYQGTLIYPTGWLDVEGVLLESTEPESREQLADRLEQLGITIGAEWAKENEARLIDNRMLALWGSTLQLMQGTEERIAAIELVADDIDQLFAGSLRKRDIVEARYGERLGFEVFGDF